MVQIDERAGNELPRDRCAGGKRVESKHKQSLAEAA
jgi:hypothetical protein